MYVRFNIDVVVEDLGDEKLLIEMNSGEGYVIDNEAYSLIECAKEQFIHINNIYSGEYTSEELEEFICDLISKNVLVKKG
ncbi:MULTISPECIES: hypothetical protein [Bacillus cereus group]|uniref:hypothetical protein n=1 Tax=Bacillus cereus group TaxID=86661 RepID=UPI001F59D9A2|nr:hypothetical protein [Bacillus pacificus]MED0823868.1 hypothetical protein [Bacillus pacificus]